MASAILRGMDGPSKRKNRFAFWCLARVGTTVSDMYCVGDDYLVEELKIGYLKN